MGNIKSDVIQSQATIHNLMTKYSVMSLNCIISHCIHYNETIFTHIYYYCVEWAQAAVWSLFQQKMYSFHAALKQQLNQKYHPKLLNLTAYHLLC